MGETAENVAERWEVGRDLQDAFALASQQKAIAAIEAGRFDAQIVPVSVPQRKGDPVVVARDEHPRADTSAEALARLRPAFRDGGTVTAGNSSGINDGLRRSSSWRPRVGASSVSSRWLACLDRRGRRRSGGDGHRAGFRRRAALERAGIAAADLDLVELGEAFASQSIVCINERNGLTRARSTSTAARSRSAIRSA
jgi:acetyl-CoA acetyltransferase